MSAKNPEEHFKSPKAKPQNTVKSIMESELPPYKTFLETFQEAALDGDAQAREWLEQSLYPSPNSMLELTATPPEVDFAILKNRQKGSASS
jgi:hypothetical protein